MTILQVVKDAAPKCGFAVPTQLIADTGATSVEIQKTLAEVADSIAQRREWSVLKTLATITGNGVATAFDYPDDYGRMLKNASMWPSTSPFNPLTHYVDSDQWLGLITQNYSPLIGGWTDIGGQINIRMGGTTGLLPNLATVKYFYISGNVFVSAANAPKSTITADDDAFRLCGPKVELRAVGERLLKLGFIAKWKQDKGRPYAQDASDFEDALAIAMGNDKGNATLTMGGGRIGRLQGQMAFPGTITP